MRKTAFFNIIEDITVLTAVRFIGEENMKLIKTSEAVGHVLCHDITRIVKDVEKGAAFRKGHIVTEEDIPVLLSIGKEHLYVWEKEAGMLHENEAAEILCKLCINEHMVRSEVKEGKIEIIAACDGLFQVDSKRLMAVNGVNEVMIATRHGNTAVKQGDKLAGTRVIPLVIAESQMAAAENAAGAEPLLSLVPFKPLKAGIITTGSEVFKGRIKDTFTPVIIEKLKAYGIEVSEHCIVDDDKEAIVKAIAGMRPKADLICCTGGMSVDPDDQTPGAIKASGAAMVTYGAPVLPGAMFALGYFDDDKVIMGLPGCVMYAKATIFDLVLPRIAAGVKLDKMDFVAYGEGGLCLNCPVCTYPNCGFGK